MFLDKKLFCIIIFSWLIIGLQAQRSFKRDLFLMGCNFDITVIAEDQKEGDYFIDTAVKEIKRIENLISSWDASSQTSEINRQAGIKPVVVDLEILELILRALEISKITDGAFDITFASMDKIWSFDGSMGSMPSPEKIKSSVEKVGYQKIIIDKDKSSVFLAEIGMKIGFGAIGKGYAADRAKELLISLGVKGGIVNASGDMNTWGTQVNGDKWSIGIINPLDKNRVFAVLPIPNGAVVTSGNYEQFVMFDNVRYSHIIDPRSGYPSSGLASVTVFAPSAEIADALATSIFVMGKDVGLNFVNQIAKIECIIIDDIGKIFSSENIKFSNR